MPVNYNINVETQRLQVVANAVDAGPSNGFMRVLDTGNNILSSFQLSRPMGVASAGVLTFNGLSIIDAAAAASGIPTGARLEDSTGVIVASGLTVGLSTASDIIISPAQFITAGQTVALTAATITGN